ncbi:MAG: hypothetical protein ACREIF_05915 [Chthoniobacterales bacterium]
MEKRPFKAEKTRRRSDAENRTSRDKVAAPKAVTLAAKEKDQPIKCASPPCYLPEIED